MEGFLGDFGGLFSGGLFRGEGGGYLSEIYSISVYGIVNGSYFLSVTVKHSAKG